MSELDNAQVEEFNIDLDDPRFYDPDPEEKDNPEVLEYAIGLGDRLEDDYSEESKP